MKFKKIALAMLIGAIGCMGVLVGCGEEPVGPDPVEPDAHTTHTYDWTETKPASCTEKGSRHGVCTFEGCDAEKDEDIPMIAHTWGEVTEKTPGTCLAKGAGERECESCHTKQEVELEMGDHDLTHHAAVAPTCKDDGNFEYWSCSVCKKNFSDAEGKEQRVEQTLNPATNVHIWGDDDMCIYGCGTANPDAAHTVHAPLTAYAEVPSTCAVAGTAAYWECGFCHKLFSSEEATDETEIAAPVALPLSTEHPEDTITHFAETEGANCITAGTIEYWQCGVCENRFDNEDCEGEPLTDEQVHGGEFGLMHAEPRLHGAAKATCRDKGYSIDCLECLACEKVFVSNYNPSQGILTELEVFGPEDVNEETGKVPDKEDGTYVIVTPITAEHYYYEETKVDEAGKPVLDENGKPIVTVYGGIVFYEGKAATCDVKNRGYHDYWQCNYCYKKYKDETLKEEWTDEEFYLPAVAHPADQLKWEDETDSTCIQHGHIGYFTCGVCGEHWLTEDTTVDPLGEDEIKKSLVEHVFSIMARNDVEHWEECEVCHKQGVHDLHDFADEGAADKECSICGYTEMSLAPLFHYETKADGTLKIVGINVTAYDNFVRQNGAITVLRIPDVTPDGLVTEIQCLFSYWESSYNTIVEVMIPASVTTVQSVFMGIGGSGNGEMFKSANTIKKVTFDRNSTEYVKFTRTEVKGWLSQGTFATLSNLEEVVLPRYMENFTPEMFERCTSLTKITMPEKVKQGGDLDRTFIHCKKLTSIDLTCMEDAESAYKLVGTFAYCDNLESVYLAKGKGLTLAASSFMTTFYGCLKITDVYYTGTANEWKRVKKDGAGGYPDSSFDTAQLHYSGDWLA